MHTAAAHRFYVSDEFFEVVAFFSNQSIPGFFTVSRKFENSVFSTFEKTKQKNTYLNQIKVYKSYFFMNQQVYHNHMQKQCTFPFKHTNRTFNCLYIVYINKHVCL